MKESYAEAVKKMIDDMRKRQERLKMKEYDLKKNTWDFDGDEIDEEYEKQVTYDEMEDALMSGDVVISDSSGSTRNIDDLLDSLGYDTPEHRVSRVRKGPKVTAAEFETFTKEAMKALVEAGVADFVLLKNDKLRAWWQHVLAEELREQTRLEEIERVKRVKEAALAKLSDEEKKILGLDKKRLVRPAWK